MPYIQKAEIRWSDLDPNFHLRHSVYYDLGAYCRIAFLYDNGITAAVMAQNEIGPILFREECFFKREIKFGDEVTVSLKLRSVSSDFRKFSMLHEIYKNGDELAAVLNVDGAWMHTRLRKIVPPPEIVHRTMDVLEKTEDFTMF